MDAVDAGRRRLLGAGVAGGCLLLCPPLARRGAADEAPEVAAMPLPVFDERVGYCCAACTPESCAFLSRDPEVRRKKAAELTARLGREISPDELGCSRCRVADDKAADSIRACSIRRCVVSRTLASCAHCAELPGCGRANPLTRERALAIRRELLVLSGKETR